MACDLGYPGLVAITCDPRLKTDASGLKIVHNAGFDQVCQELRKLSWPVVAEVCSMLDPPHQPPARGLAETVRLELLTRYSL